MNDLFVHLPGPDHEQVLLDDMHSLTYNPTWPTATQSLRNSLKPIHLHVYDTPLMDWEIRLLMLKIGNGDDVIYCTLDNRSLDNMPEGTKYFALSYVWGNSDETTTNYVMVSSLASQRIFIHFFDKFVKSQNGILIRPSIHADQVSGRVLIKTATTLLNMPEKTAILIRALTFSHILKPFRKRWRYSYLCGCPTGWDPTTP